MWSCIWCNVSCGRNRWNNSASWANQHGMYFPKIFTRSLLLSLSASFLHICFLHSVSITPTQMVRDTLSSHFDKVWCLPSFSYLCLKWRKERFSRNIWSHLILLSSFLLFAISPFLYDCVSLSLIPTQTHIFQIVVMSKCKKKKRSCHISLWIQHEEMCPDYFWSVWIQCVFSMFPTAVLDLWMLFSLSFMG